MHSISISQLAKQMHSLKEQGEKPYLLLLGAGVSISSGHSSMNGIIDQFLIDFSIVNDEELIELDRDERFARFVDKMESLSESERCTWLQKCFKDAKPSMGYMALTRLVEEGYFDTILTTNWDNLLNSSLEKSKIIRNKTDFRFYVRGVEKDEYIIKIFQKSAVPRIKILKVHGELDSQVIFVTPKQTANFPSEIAEFLKLYFKQRDLIMLGHSASDIDIQKCIEQNERNLIYVNPKSSHNQFVLALAGSYKTAQQIVGRDAEFDVFMRKLFDAILMEDYGMRGRMPFSWLEKIGFDVQRIRENLDWMVEYLKNQQKN